MNVKGMQTNHHSWFFYDHNNAGLKVDLFADILLIAEKVLRKTLRELELLKKGYLIIIIIIIGHFRAPFLKKSSRRFTTLSIGSLKYYTTVILAVIPFIKNFHP